LTASTRSQRDALEMLGGAGDAEGEIAARLYQAARGTDLPAARQQPGVANDAAAALGRTQRGGDLMEGGPVADAIAGADDEIRFGQRYGIGICRGQPTIRQAALLDRAIDGRQRLCRPQRAGDGIRRFRRQQKDAWGPAQEIAGPAIAAAAGLLGREAQHPHRGRLAEGGGDTPPDIPATGRALGKEDMARPQSRDGCEHGGCLRLRRVAGRQRHRQQMVGPGGGEIRRDVGGSQDHQIAGTGIGKQPPRAQQVAIMGIELAILQIGNSENQAGRSLNRRALRQCCYGGLRRRRRAGRPTAGARIAADASAGSGLRRGRLRRGLAQTLGPGIAPDSTLRTRRLDQASALDAQPAHSAASSSSAISATAGRGPTTPSSMTAQLGQATASTGAPVSRA